MAFHESGIPDPCTTSGAPGTACADGQTVYAGSWNGNRYYTTTADQSAGARWGANGVNLGSNGTDGLSNTNTAVASIEGNPQAGACNTSPFNPPACTPNALLLCKDLRTTLGGEWYLPAQSELVNVLYANNVAIGGFSNAPYWSSTSLPLSSFTYAYFVEFSDGTNNNGTSRLAPLHVRCVKTE